METTLWWWWTMREEEDNAFDDGLAGLSLWKAN